MTSIDAFRDIALGASRRAILKAVTHHVLSPISIGAILGLVVAVPIGFGLAQSPLQLAIEDPISYAAALVTLGVAGLTAAFIPAMRALLADPIHALRHE